MSKLCVIAMISGGKDSLFSILHCMANGHDVVALANLYPLPEDTVSRGSTLPSESTSEECGEDIDSHMYQTVGHRTVHLYADALKLPLYREPIRGKAISKHTSYQHELSKAAASGEEDDETASLVPLLRQCLAIHPQANAVSTGAILSTYQRTRFESVAMDLGLIPLSYLWHYPYLPPYTQSSLLHDMAAVGQDARIIKVASGGLGAEHLWMNVANPATASKIGRDMARFGGGEVGAVLGEGGEYETLAIDGPRALWKGRIVVNSGDMISIGGDAGSATMQIKNAQVESKDIASHLSGLESLRIPPLLDTEFASMLALAKSSRIPFQSSTNTRIIPKLLDIPITVKPVESYVTFSNLTSTGSNTAAIQMKAILGSLNIMLEAQGIQSSQIVCTMLLLRSMADFTSVNVEYGKLCNFPNPPARVTVACGATLPEGVQVVASFIASRVADDQRRGLHVQSRSYWAPANIGPYSQAIAAPLGSMGEAHGNEIVCVSGQIPLVPSSMQIVSQDFDEQAVLGLQHLWRIGRAMGVHWWVNAIVYITPSTPDGSVTRARKIALLWRIAHRDGFQETGDEDLETTDIGEQSLYHSWMASNPGTGNHDATLRPPLPGWGRVKTRGGTTSFYPPPLAVIEVSELPRGALIEWSCSGIAGDDIIRVEADHDTRCNHVEGFSMAFGRRDEIPLGEVSFAGMTDIYTSSHITDGIVSVMGAKVVPCSAVLDSEGVQHETVLVRRSCE